MEDFIKIWKEKARNKNVTDLEVVHYCMLKAMRDYQEYKTEHLTVRAEFYLKRAFSPIRSKTKLDNGRYPYDKIYLKSFRFTYGDLYPCLKEGFETELFETLRRELYQRFNPLSELSIKKEYVYTFVRQDMSPEYQLVQAAHATAKMGQRTVGTAEWFDKLNFAIIGVRNETELLVAMGDCKEVGLKTYEFVEPDIGNKLTAFSTSPILGCKRKRLLHYKKLKFNHMNA